MKRQIERGEFVEFAEVHGNYYGTRLVMHYCIFCFVSFGLVYICLCCAD